MNKSEQATTSNSKQATPNTPVAAELPANALTMTASCSCRLKCSQPMGSLQPFASWRRCTTAAMLFTAAGRRPSKTRPSDMCSSCQSNHRAGRPGPQRDTSRHTLGVAGKQPAAQGGRCPGAAAAGHAAAGPRHIQAVAVEHRHNQHGCRLPLLQVGAAALPAPLWQGCQRR